MLLNISSTCCFFEVSICGLGFTGELKICRKYSPLLRANRDSTMKHATYIGSWEKSVDIPKSPKPEFAFIGRSNVGKSSLINMLVGQKELARTSSTPGKTQTINLFDVDQRLHICDLPGYGYAKVSKKRRLEFKNMIRHYLVKRENLYALFVLIDLRIPPQEIDLDFINDCGVHGIPLVLIGTKSDKLKPPELSKNLEAIKSALKESWEELPPFIVSSALDKTGQKEILEVVEDAIQRSQQ